MKNLFGLLFVCALFALTSCGDDGCTEDLAGTYTGTLSCTILGDSDATVTITGTDGNYAITGAGLLSADLKQDGCTLSYDETPLGTGEKATITLSGTTLTVVREITALSVTTETCTFTGTK